MLLCDCQVLRMLAQWEILDEAEGRKFSPNAATRLLVRGMEATLGHFVVRISPLSFLVHVVDGHFASSFTPQSAWIWAEQRQLDA